MESAERRVSRRDRLWNLPLTQIWAARWRARKLMLRRDRIRGASERDGKIAGSRSRRRVPERMRRLGRCSASSSDVGSDFQAASTLPARWESVSSGGRVKEARRFRQLSGMWLRGTIPADRDSRKFRAKCSAWRNRGGDNCA